MDEGCVIFKASSNGFVITIQDNCDLDVIIFQIKKKINSASNFFIGANLDVWYRGRELSINEEKLIFELLKNTTKANIGSFKKFVEEKNEEVKIDQIVNINEIQNLFFNGINEGITKFHRGTVRSGQRIEFNGNVVIIGDVNPGGEIVAAGNVVVIGALRGIVHAGADGNKEAIIVALSLHPVQLRIAEIITRSPDEKQEKFNFPELAFIKENQIIIESFLYQR